MGTLLGCSGNAQNGKPETRTEGPSAGGSSGGGPTSAGQGGTTGTDGAGGGSSVTGSGDGGSGGGIAGSAGAGGNDGGVGGTTSATNGGMGGTLAEPPELPDPEPVAGPYILISEGDDYSDRATNLTVLEFESGTRHDAMPGVSVTGFESLSPEVRWLG